MDRSSLKIAHSLSASMAALVFVVQAATIGIALQFAWTDAQSRAMEAMNVAYSVADSFLHERRQQLETSVDVVTRDFALRKAVATGDLPTADSAIRNHAARVNADHTMLIDPQGQVLISSGEALPIDSALWQDIQQGAEGLILLADSQSNLYQLVLAPVEAPRTIGWVSLGFEVNTELATQLSAMTGSTVAFVDRTDTQVYAASSSAAIDESSTVQVAKPLESLGAGVTLALSRDRWTALSGFVQLRNFTLLVAVLAIALAVAVAVLLARRLTGTLSSLASTAKRVQAGDYSSALHERGHQEVVDLAKALNQMQQDIAEREQRLEHQTLHDALTGLPNQQFALQRIDDWIQLGANATVTVAVVTGLEELNSSLGLELGDETVRELARAFELMNSDFVARISDNRFLLLHRNTQNNAIERMAKQARASLQIVGVSDAIEVRCDVFFGAARSTDGDNNATALLRMAWSASLEALDRQQPLAWYHEDFASAQERRLTIMRDLRSAVLDHQLFLLYQPKLSAATGTFTSAEALLRWNHPELGPVPVDEFIEVAEQTEDINRLTRWVIREALAQLREWRRENEHFQVCVNISPRDLLDHDFTEFVRQTLLEHCLPGTALELEVTERAIVEDSDRSVAALAALSHMGISIAIDDYGTGFSSLAQLKNVPANVLKIDKGFVMKLVTDEADQHIVRSTIGLGHALGMKVVAEGVEDLDSLKQLVAWGCDTLQGYYLSKPIEPAKIAEFIHAHPNEDAAQSAARTG